MSIVEQSRELSSWQERSKAVSEPAPTSGFASGGKAAVGKRVVVVEDNVDSARALAMLLEEMGHRAEYAINGYAGLALLKTFKPHIVLLDLGLPGMSGYEFCRRLKTDESSREIRVVVLSAYGSQEHRARSHAVGCEVHLVKPVCTAVLEEILK